MRSASSGGERLAPVEAAGLRRLLQEVGPRRAVELVGIPEHTLLRMAAEMPGRRVNAEERGYYHDPSVENAGKHSPSSEKPCRFICGQCAGRVGHFNFSSQPHPNLSNTIVAHDP